MALPNHTEPTLWNPCGSHGGPVWTRLVLGVGFVSHLSSGILSSLFFCGGHRVIFRLLLVLAIGFASYLLSSSNFSSLSYIFYGGHRVIIRLIFGIGFISHLSSGTLSFLSYIFCGGHQVIIRLVLAIGFASHLLSSSNFSSSYIFCGEHRVVIRLLYEIGFVSHLLSSGNLSSLSYNLLVGIASSDLYLQLGLFHIFFLLATFLFLTSSVVGIWLSSDLYLELVSHLSSGNLSSLSYIVCGQHRVIISHRPGQVCGFGDYRWYPLPWRPQQLLPLDSNYDLPPHSLW